MREVKVLKVHGKDTLEKSKDMYGEFIATLLEAFDATARIKGFPAKSTWVL